MVFLNMKNGHLKMPNKSLMLCVDQANNAWPLNSNVRLKINNRSIRRLGDEFVDSIS